MANKIRVLVVDDSATARKLLSHIVNAAQGLEVAGQAEDGRRSVEMVKQIKPNVILMDVTMPVMDGLAATREIMNIQPTPIVITSAGLKGRETEIAFQAMRAGALTVIPKPAGPGDPAYTAQAMTLQNTLRSMSAVRVIHHRHQPEPKPGPDPSMRAVSSPPVSAKLVAIAASTGGPAALSEILKVLPDDFAIPVVIAQHMAGDFIPSLVDWLDSICKLQVQVAEVGQRPRPGNVYISPGEGHLYISPDYQFKLDTITHARYTPSADILFKSVANYYQKQAVGVILTGMGDDGARGLRLMFDAGAYTIAQDEATCVVYGMPREAANLGAVHKTLPLPEIARMVADLNR